MNLDLLKIKHVHFVGIGGIGISAIARLMLSQWKDVTGQDMQEGLVVDELSKLGAKIMIGQSYENIPSDTELIVYTTAIITYDPKFFVKIKEQQKILIRSYPEMLGLVTKDKYTIAVSGTHGKTTTTAMIAKILVDTGKDPSVIVGSLLKESNSNLIIGESDFFVVEACEYERSFLNLKPKILVITNIEEDHLDYYKDISDIESAFSEIADQTDNFIVCDPSSVSVSNILKKKYKAKVIDYRDYLDKVPKLSVPGVHNRMNAAVVLALADILNIKEKNVQKSLSEFSGTWRRLEKRGETSAGTIIYDDYAHHPTEIKASLEALRELYPVGEKKITVLFQPHLYSRTKALFNNFSKCFKVADNIFLLPIFFAREEKDESISSEKLALAISLAGDKAKAFSDFKMAEDFIKELNLGKDDVFITMGAGEAYKVADKVFKF
ncbi:UDP-N-acetylmuramate--L-alanine ligase [Candidatus Nomurabacteria bacterium CG_4_9_14_0_2_um_filter_32_10]|uniref:UDP-N-acetylmuramate--L-alanine ligase n=2 Tax=Candidatus Nomuraibacteriota TaxID=1752729 RepID=A0A2H0CIR9_9BACT|nr:MAG: UDP-N-acetylmuramate--L-alanine ligase [Candidatus Nomurabacteria bacterium CG22_combo_CG10-13_8_21_14_all_32_8]PJC49512.1 MAG: UDP-N-acetylmuramate--L-alanine ligase [Candidatus Nomurabacteria bacterium CG_4_9_14_0_2_um_filter_32_10]